MLPEAAALVALLVAASDAPGAGAAEGGAGPDAPQLALRPPILTLGQGDRATVVVRSRDGPPRLVASAGTLGAVREVEPGVFEAEFDPPLETHPQLALVAAIAADRVAFGCLPLVGRGVAVVRTEPRARIGVRIREREFGPAVADAAGVALVPVEVPPGERVAYHRDKPLELRAPPLRQVFVFTSRDAVGADRDDTVKVYVLAATEQGAPWRGAPVEVSASAGRLGEMREVAPGAFTVEWALRRGNAGPASVEARLGESRARAEIARAPGAPARLTLSLERDRAAAGDRPVEVTAEIVDGAGNRVDGELRLTAIVGVLEGLERVAPGLSRARLAIPERLEGRSAAVVEAVVGELADRRVLALAPAEPPDVTLVVRPSELPGDGVSTAEVEVSVKDRFGNAASVPPELAASRGALGPLDPVAPGEWRGTYASPWARGDGEDSLVARAGSVTASAAIRLRDAPRQLGAAARAGARFVLGAGSSPSVGAAIEIFPARLGGDRGASFELGWIPAGERRSFVVGGAAHLVSSRAALLPFDVTALERRPLGPRLAAFAGAGAGVAAVHSLVELDGARVADERGVALGAHAVAGATLRVLPHALVHVRARLGWQSDPGLRSYRGSAAWIDLSVGVTHEAL